jgi:hypothetical protein
VDSAQRPSWGAGMFPDVAVRELDRPPSLNGRIGPVCSRRPTTNGSNGDNRPSPKERIGPLCSRRPRANRRALWEEQFAYLSSPVCVRKVSQVGLNEPASELQVVILEWLGTAAKLAAHLAQVSQVDQVPWARGCVSGQARHQGRQDRHMIWRAALACSRRGAEGRSMPHSILNVWLGNRSVAGRKIRIALAHGHCKCFESACYANIQ